MNNKFIKILCDVHCDWEGLPPIYRVYVDDELFAERTWNYRSNQYLEEMLQIDASPGTYQLSYQLVPPHLAQMRVENIRVAHGPASVKGTKIRIHDESH
jgi:hypothetical protein